MPFLADHWLFWEAAIIRQLRLQCFLLDTIQWTAKIILQLIAINQISWWVEHWLTVQIIKILVVVRSNVFAWNQFKLLQRTTGKRANWISSSKHGYNSHDISCYKSGFYPVTKYCRRVSRTGSLQHIQNCTGFPRFESDSDEIGSRSVLAN